MSVGRGSGGANAPREFENFGLTVFLVLIGKKILPHLPLLKNFGKILWWTPLEKILPTPIVTWSPIRVLYRPF